MRAPQSAADILEAVEEERRKISDMCESFKKIEGKVFSIMWRLKEHPAAMPEERAEGESLQSATWPQERALTEAVERFSELRRALYASGDPMHHTRCVPYSSQRESMWRCCREARDWSGKERVLQEKAGYVSGAFALAELWKNSISSNVARAEEILKAFQQHAAAEAPAAVAN